MQIFLDYCPNMETVSIFLLCGRTAAAAATQSNSPAAAVVVVVEVVAAGSQEQHCKRADRAVRDKSILRIIFGCTGCN